MKIDLKKICRNWKWNHWVILGLVVFVVIQQVADRHRLRKQPIQSSDIDLIEEDIQEYTSMAERLTKLEVLPPVKEQWRYAVSIASAYGVQLGLVSGERSHGAGTGYRGPLGSWTGKLSGHTGSVLVTARSIQQTVPTYLYEFNINGDQSTLVFSVLGSD